MPYDPHDTICAIATAAGGAARGIVRISGRNTVSIVGRLFHADDGGPLTRLRQACLRSGQVRIDSSLSDSSSHGGMVLPVDLFLWPTSRSYTREPVAELHTIGSPPLLEAITVALCQSGVRLAEPGEFTLRAFLAGRIDLTQAEAVLGVIDSHDDAELRAALGQLAGGIARPLQTVREDLLQLLAELEAGLDFVDEEIEFVSQDETRTRLASTRSRLAEVAQQMESRSIAGPVAQVVLVGRPNVGKSSLFNALVDRFGVSAGGSDHRSPALVSPQRGTTRDYATAVIDLDGMQCEFVDTAGVDDVFAKSGNASSPPAPHTKMWHR